MDASGRSATALAALLAGAGALHFATPKAYEQIVPRWLPARRAVVYASGVAEIGCAVGLWHPPTRRFAGWAAVGLLVAVFPANVQMAIDARSSASRTRRWLTYVRLPMQAPLVWWALHVARAGANDPLVSMAGTRRRGAIGSASDL